MDSQTLAVVLFILGVAIGVFGGWIKPPDSLSARAILAIFGVLLVLAGVIVFAQARPVTSPDTTTQASTAKAVSAPYVTVDRFRRVGPTDPAFAVTLSGAAITIKTPDSDRAQWGVRLPDHDWCGDGSVSFDATLDKGSGMYGLAVVPGGVEDHHTPTGQAMLFYRDTDGTFIAAYSSLPTPFIGAAGGGSYAVAPLTSTRHITVEITDKTYSVWVDGTRAGDYATLDTQDCGQLMLLAWGGATAHIDHVVLH